VSGVAPILLKTVCDRTANQTLPFVGNSSHAHISDRQGEARHSSIKMGDSLKAAATATQNCIPKSQPVVELDKLVTVK